MFLRVVGLWGRSGEVAGGYIEGLVFIKEVFGVYIFVFDI